MSGYERAYRRLLRLYPDRFVGEYAEEMALVFAEQLRDTQRAHGAVAAAQLWVRAALDLLWTLPGEHLRKEIVVTQPVDAIIASSAAPTPGPRSTLRLVVGLAPVWLFVGAAIASPRALDPLLESRVALLGVPAGIFVLGVAAALMGTGLIALRAWRSAPGAVVAVVVFTLPSLVLVLVAPAAVLAFANLS